MPDPLVYQFQDANGDPIDLTGYTVKYVVRERWSTAPVTYNGDFEDAATGKVRYTWVGGEFPTAGEYFSSFWTDNGTNRYASWLITYTVRLPVGVVPF